jgi:hypothetical protein
MPRRWRARDAGPPRPGDPDRRAGRPQAGSPPRPSPRPGRRRVCYQASTGRPGRRVVWSVERLNASRQHASMPKP